jgi:serine protease Do
MTNNNVQKNKNSTSIGIQISYLFGISVCISSVWFSGFEDNPRREFNNSRLSSLDKSVYSANDTRYHYLEPTKLKGFPTVNPILLQVFKTIDIPISNRKSSGTGTAFKIGLDRWITARHVVNDCKEVFLSGKKIFNIFLPPSSDLAMLISQPSLEDTFELGWMPDLKNKILVRPDFKIGEQGFSMGYPKGKPGQAHLMFAGYIGMKQHGAYHLKEPVKMWVENQRQPKNLDQMGGISGGPIFDKEGHIVGVHVANSIRRGRAYSVDEYALTWLLQATKVHDTSSKTSVDQKVTLKNWSQIAEAWRKSGLIRKVLCSV